MSLTACPCCGYRTLDERGNYGICKVCWWEDDGQDNEHADEAFGGPNYGISLTQGRTNFLIHGIYDPERKDLIRLKVSPETYEKGRFFKIQDGFLFEEGTDWKSKLEP